MKYKNGDDNRYRVQFMVSTEKLMDQLTVKEFISYLEENAEFEDFTMEYIDKKCVKCRAYDLKEADSNLRKEFLVTEDGRVFYWRSLNSRIELVDKEIESEKDRMKEKKTGTMERPKFLNTVTVGDARRKYRENQKTLDNIMFMVSLGVVQEVFSDDNEWAFNQVMTETILQQEYIRERERANWGWDRGVVDFSKQGSCIL